MLRQLINHSLDLQRLIDEGFQLEFVGGHLVVRHIPYVNSEKRVEYGTLVSELTVSGNRTARPSTHVIFFIGEHPCYNDGEEIEGIKHSSGKRVLHHELTIDHCFSNKPKGGYNDYYEKVRRYATIISDQAKSLVDSVTECPFLPPHDDNPESVFQYYDYNSSRASINPISAKLQNQKIGIVGLGGTGAYILDFVAKTPVAEIHLFDDDVFMTHNAFRSPGAASKDKLNDEPKKVDYYHQVFSKMHKGVIAHQERVTSHNLEKLSSLDYVFIAVDNANIKPVIFEYLYSKNITFIDVGMSLINVDNQLLGQLRTTTGTDSNFSDITNRVSMTNGKEDEYSSNIQIAELNAFNAMLAVIKWKKLSGFYQDLGNEFNTVYDLNTSSLFNESSLEA